MKVKIDENADTEIETNDDNSLPPEEIVKEDPIVEEKPIAKEPDSQRILELEKEKARLEGINSVLSKQPAQANANSPQAVKAQVWADMNSLTNEEFEAKWKTEKFKASAALLEQDNIINRQNLAEARVEARLAAKFGKDYLAVQDEVNSMIADASPEVRQDPERLARFAERAYLAASKEKAPEPTSKPKGESMQRSKITGSFEKPNSAHIPSKKEDNDDIPSEFRTVAHAFGLRSEKERKKLMESDYVEMDMGAGIVFRDPNKGFEKVTKVA